MCKKFKTLRLQLHTLAFLTKKRKAYSLAEIRTQVTGSRIPYDRPLHYETNNISCKQQAAFCLQLTLIYAHSVLASQSDSLISAHYQHLKEYHRKLIEVCFCTQIRPFPRPFTLQGWADLPQFNLAETVSQPLTTNNKIWPQKFINGMFTR